MIATRDEVWMAKGNFMVMKRASQELVRCVFIVTVESHLLVELVGGLSWAVVCQDVGEVRVMCARYINGFSGFVGLNRTNGELPMG